jgi:hypothetical protein
MQLIRKKFKQSKSYLMAFPESDQKVKKHPLEIARRLDEDDVHRVCKVEIHFSRAAQTAYLLAIVVAVDLRCCSTVESKFDLN